MQHVIITGGSSGIGEAFARAYLARGCRVTIIARSHERLAQAAQRLSETYPVERLQAVPADVCDASALQAAIARAESDLGPCARLITSAGIVRPGRFDALADDDIRRQMEVNYFGTVNAIKAVYPAMKARRDGRILLVASGAGLIGIYGYTAYAASKFALVGLAESLQAEAVRHHVGISICYPPDTDTPQLAAELEHKPVEAKAMSRLGGLWTADQVANRSIPAFERGRFNIHLGAGIVTLGLFGGLVRPVFRRWMARR